MTVCWLLAAAALTSNARSLEQALDVGPRVRGSESAAVEYELRGRFDSPLGVWVLARDWFLEREGVVARVEAARA